MEGVGVIRISGVVKMVMNEKREKDQEREGVWGEQKAKTKHPTN